MSRDLPMSRMCDAMLVKPDKAYSRGEPINQYLPKSSYHTWQLNSQDKLDSEDINEHFRWVADVLEPSRQRFLALFEEEEWLDVTFGVLYRSSYRNQNVGPHLSPESLQTIAAYRASLSIDACFLREEKLNVS